MSNRKLLTILLILAMAFVLSACHDNDDPSPDTDAMPTHTVIVIFPWTGSATSASGGLSQSLRANIDSIDAATQRMGSLGTCRVMLFHATAPHTATLSEITVDRGTVNHIPVRTYDGITYSLPDLVGLLNDAVRAAPTGRYSLIIGSHATGWLPPGSRPQRGLPRPTTGMRRAWGGLSADMQASVERLDSAIRLSAMRHADYALFDGCYMANIETAYALRQSVTWLVASTSEVLANGMPYQLTWRELTAEQPSWQRVVAAFYDFYSSYRYPYGALSVTDCRVATDAARLMRRLNDAARTDNLSLTGLTLQALDGYTPHVFFDMRQYATLLASRTPSTDITTDSIGRLFDRLVPHYCSTPRLYSAFLNGGASFHVGNNNGGLTISDFTDNATARAAVESTAWWAATRPWTAPADGR